MEQITKEEYYAFEELLNTTPYKWIHHPIGDSVKFTLPGIANWQIEKDKVSRPSGFNVSIEGQGQGAYLIDWDNPMTEEDIKQLKEFIWKSYRHGIYMAQLKMKDAMGLIT